MGETTGNWALNLEILNAQVKCRGAKQEIKIHDEVNCFLEKKLHGEKSKQLGEVVPHY